MPITLNPISRRQFLAGSVATGLGLLLSNDLFAADVTTDPHRLALLSDIHIAADPTTLNKDVVMYDHLTHVCGEVIALDPKPTAAIINGDCAYLHGEIADYQTLLKPLATLRERGFPIHLTMGNHDSRDHLWKTIADSESHVEPLPDKQVMVLEFPRANLFLLDSLDVTNKTPGVLGEKQLHWLGTALDARMDKPSIVMVHHNPDEKAKPTGLTDTKELLDLLIPRRNVKALFYGHTHVWEIAERSGLHCVNLPAVAYVFKVGQPSGWVDAHILENGMSLELHTVDPAHPKHGDKVELSWRT
jgi:predicted phosphodiesterase